MPLMILEDFYRLLRNDHVRAQGVFDTIEQPLVVLDQSLCVVSANIAFFETFKVDRDDTIGSSVFSLGNGQWEIPELRQLLGDVIPKSKAVVDFEVTHDFPAIGRRTMLVSARRLVVPNNNTTNIFVAFEDVTDDRRRSAEADLVLDETRHRLKNLLAVVRSIASQTKAKGRSGEEYRDAFLARFEAFLQAEAFVEAGQPKCSLDTLVTEALASVDATKLHVECTPKVELERQQVLPIRMILHELLTNAMKHGALSAESGSVQVRCEAMSDDGEETVVLNWREEGGPYVSPPSQPGFGTRAIERSASGMLGGKTELRFEPGGLQVTISFPTKKES